MPFEEVAYNNSVHSNTEFTPFKVVSGQDFVVMPELPQEKPQRLSLAKWIMQLQNIWPVARKALEEAHQAHKKQADKKWVKPKDFKVVIEFTSL